MFLVRTNIERQKVKKAYTVHENSWKKSSIFYECLTPRVTSCVKTFYDDDDDDDELFCGMVDQRKAFSLISSCDHCQRSSPSRISDTLQAGFEPVQNLNSGIVE